MTTPNHTSQSESSGGPRGSPRCWRDMIMPSTCRIVPWAAPFRTDETAIHCPYPYPTPTQTLETHMMRAKTKGNSVHHRLDSSTTRQQRGSRDTRVTSALQPLPENLSSPCSTQVQSNVHLPIRPRMPLVLRPNLWQLEAKSRSAAP